MTKSKKTSSFRFDSDFIEQLNTWSFVSKKEKGVLLQEAFKEYVKMTENKIINEKVNMIMDGLK